MFFSVLTLSLGIIGLITGVASIILSVKTLIELKALKNSTHSIQYVPITEQSDPQSVTDEKITKRFVKAGIINEPFDSQPDEVIL